MGRRAGPGVATAAPPSGVLATRGGGEARSEGPGSGGCVRAPGACPGPGSPSDSGGFAPRVGQCPSVAVGSVLRFVRLGGGGGWKRGESASTVLGFIRTQTDAGFSLNSLLSFLVLN